MSDGAHYLTATNVTHAYVAIIDIDLGTHNCRAFFCYKLHVLRGNTKVINFTSIIFFILIINRNYFFIDLMKMFSVFVHALSSTLMLIFLKY